MQNLDRDIMPGMKISIPRHQYNIIALQWHHECDGISNCLRLHCLLNSWFRRRSKLCVTGLCVENSPVTGEFSAQKACNVKNVSIWWRHHGRARINALGTHFCGQKYVLGLIYWNHWCLSWDWILICHDVIVNEWDIIQIPADISWKFRT